MNINRFLKFNFLLFLAFETFQALSGYENHPVELYIPWESFSPGTDSIRNVLNVSIKNPDQLPGSVTDWLLNIKNEQGQAIRSFRAERRLIRQRPALHNLFFPGDDDVRKVTLFETIQWDGKDESGQPVPDGNYAIEGWLQVGAGDRLYFANRTVTVDRQMPGLQIQVDRAVYRLPSPDHPTLPGDSPAPIVIQQLANSDPGTKYSIQIENEAGRIVYSRPPEETINSTFQWAARDNDREQVPEGVYTYRLTAEDPAGNLNVVYFDHLIVSTKELILDLRNSASGISPEGDGNFDTIRFWIEPVPERKRFLENWNQRLKVTHWMFSILNESGRGIRKLEGMGPVPSHVEWDGRNQLGDLASDGFYFVTFSLDTSMGRVESLPYRIALDTRKPRISGHTSVDRFTPDGDGEGDTLCFYLAGEDESGIADWSIEILSSSSPAGGLIQKYSGKGDPPEQIIWKGSGYHGNPVDSFESLDVRYTATDRYGNKMVRLGPSLKTGPLFRVLEPGKSELIVRIPSKNHFDALDQLTLQGKTVLEQFLNAYKRYKKYDIYIEVHSGEPGEEEENLFHSEKRAREIRDFFLDHGIEEPGLFYKGMGESELLYSSEFQHLRYRNQRIQIRLKEHVN